MNINMLINKVNSHPNGTFFNMSWASDVPLKASAKRQGVNVYKLTIATVRKGINYSAMKSVQDKVASGRLELKHELPWGTWSAEHPGLIINHTNKKGESKQYIRLYATPNKAQSRYFLNGKPIDKSELMALGYVQDSYWKKDPNDIDCYTVCTANVQDVW